jgi:dipeptidyl aminopeptidase/acylaminoacyl peptidase
VADASAAEAGGRRRAGSWRSPILLIHADDDCNVPFHQTLELGQRVAENGVKVETQVIPDDVHDFLLFKSWRTVLTATAEYLEAAFLPGSGGPASAR